MVIVVIKNLTSFDILIHTHNCEGSYFGGIWSEFAVWPAFVWQRSVEEQRVRICSVQRELRDLRGVLGSELSEELPSLRASLDSLRQQVAVTESLREHLGKSSLIGHKNVEESYWTRWVKLETHYSTFVNAKVFGYTSSVSQFVVFKTHDLHGGLKRWVCLLNNTKKAFPKFGYWIGKGSVGNSWFWYSGYYSWAGNFSLCVSSSLPHNPKTRCRTCELETLNCCRSESPLWC